MFYQKKNSEARFVLNLIFLSLKFHCFVEFSHHKQKLKNLDKMSPIRRDSHQLFSIVHRKANKRLKVVY